jgi:hypothetical protein
MDDLKQRLNDMETERRGLNGVEGTALERLSAIKELQQQLCLRS